MKKLNYNHTIYASYTGYVTQAIVNNFAPLLFITFTRQFGLTLDKIALITTVNFMVQLLVDLLSAWLIDRIGYRVSIVAAHVFAAAGIISLAVLPFVLPDPFAGILLAVVLYAVGGGLIEVMISPIVEACPTEKKEAAMSLLHSFYCWGHVAVIIFSTLYFRLFGIASWQCLAFLWAGVPAVNAFMFAQVPIYRIGGDSAKREEGYAGGEPRRAGQNLFGSGLFWLLLLAMVCAGASEQAMSQWASAFAELALGISKTAGDLAGPCAFALLMGTARALYGKYSDRIPLLKAMTGSAILCIVSYLFASLSRLPMLSLIGCAVCGFSVGIFWTGTFSIAAKRLPSGGMSMFAFLALAGDLGCSGGPTLAGFAANAMGGNLKKGIFAAIIFPVLMLAVLLLLQKRETGRNVPGIGLN